jgi:hypothetical protein
MLKIVNGMTGSYIIYLLVKDLTDAILDNITFLSSNRSAATIVAPACDA